MLKFIIKAFILTFTLSASAQKADSLSIKPQKINFSFRVGYDMGKKIWSRYKNGNIDEVNLNVIRKNNIIGFIYGRENMPYISQRYRFLTGGQYYKIEYSYNFFENWNNMRNEITLGMRYARAFFDYNLQAYTRIPVTAQLPVAEIEPNRRYENLTASWMEVTSSVKAEIFKNIFLELHVCGKILLQGKQPENFGLIYIPGFYTTNVSGFGFGLGYGISYLIF